MHGEMTRRILVVDDNDSIHQDYRKILAGTAPSANALRDLEESIFGSQAAKASSVEFLIDSARQGQEALELVQKAMKAGQPYAMAFVDIRMPPGWDGIETTGRLWEADPDLEVVICTAYSDYSWDETTSKLGNSDRWLVLKKPFDSVEVRQLAGALSEKRRLRMEANKRMAGLEKEVSERTSSLERTAEQLRAANEDLTLARDAALSATRAKAQFLANMSHEIRTPLTAIIGYSDLLVTGGHGRDEVNGMLGVISDNCRHLQGIVNDILDFSKIEAGMLRIEPRSCGVRRLFGEVEATMRIRAESKGLDFRLLYDDALPDEIVTDAFRLKQILINLIVNAIKFTEKGSVRVMVGGERTPPAGAQPSRMRLWCEVEDTGVGMAPETLASLFQPFHQAESSTTRRFGGTGLGLSISRQLARILGGDIGVSSVPGEGSRFRLTIDAGAAQETSSPPPAPAGLGASVPSDESEEPARSELAGYRVLLAEDNPVNQNLLKTMLKSRGAEVQIAVNGAVAVTAACAELEHGQPFDVVLMDMQMPVMDGVAAVRELRKRGYAGAIVALTASALESDRQECLRIGCDGFLVKPVSMRELVAAVASARNRTASPAV